MKEEEKHCKNIAFYTFMISVIVGIIILSTAVIIIQIKSSQTRFIVCNSPPYQCNTLNNCSIIAIKGSRQMYRLGDYYVGVYTYILNTDQTITRYISPITHTCKMPIEIKTRNGKFMWMNYTFLTAQYD